MANAFNKWVALLNIMCAQMIGFNAFKELYLRDLSFEHIYIELMDWGKRDHFVFMNDYLFHSLQLCIPDCSLWEHIICEKHCKGHFGRDKTLALMSVDYYWPKLPEHVSSFVRRYAICQRSREPYQMWYLVLLLWICPRR
jgi:hypothetical protein